MLNQPSSEQLGLPRDPDPASETEIQNKQYHMLEGVVPGENGKSE